ncbi:MAG: putative porin [Bacteroidota bacterium]
MLRRLFFLLLLISVSKFSFAIGDDSTYHRYNPLWTKYFHPNFPDWKRGLDTSINSLHDYDYLQQEFGWMNLGSNATPAFKTVYHSQYDADLKWGMTESVTPYLLTPDKLKFYNTVKPYTHLFYVTGSKLEQQLVGTHTQNIGRNSNVGFEFTRHGVPGFYQRQHANIFNVDVFANVKTKNERYELSPYIIFNRLKWELNGGVNEDSVFTNPLLIDKSLAQVNLNNASASLRGNNYGAYQSYSWGNKYVTKINDTTFQSHYNSNVRLLHQIDFSKYGYRYSDDTLDFSFYPQQIYLSTDSTHDTSSYSDLHNEIALQWGEIKSLDSTNTVYRMLPFKIYASHDLHRFTYHSTAFVNELKAGVELTSNFMKNKTEIRKLHFYLDANAGTLSTGDFEYHFNSYLSYHLWGAQYFHFVVESNRIPAAWTMNHYYSNHYFWNNSFTPSTESFVEIAFTAFKNYSNFGLKYMMNQNPIYYSVTAAPAQYNGTLNGWCIYISENFKFGKIHLDNEIGINLLDEKVFSYPTYVGKHSLYFEGNLFKKALGLCTGLEINYVSDYYAPRFNPANLTFYQQNTLLLKYYPVADYFINLKIKSARIFLRLENLDQHLFYPGYFTSPDYPAADRSFKFGVSWMFWN